MANKMPWIKIAAGYLRDEKIHFIIKRYGHDTMVFWTGLLTECRNGVLEMDEEIFAEICLLDQARFEEIKKIFIKFDLVTECNGQKLKVTNWEKYQFSDSYERVKKHREKAVTGCNDPVTDEKHFVTIEVEEEVEETYNAREKLALPDYIDGAIWGDFKKNRKSLRAPVTAIAEKRLLNTLAKLHGDGHNVNEVIERSIENGWKSFFPLDRRSANSDTWRGVL